MSQPAFRLVLLVPALTLAAGCAAPGPFPSLAPRAVEKLRMDEPVREAPIVAADPRLASRIAELLAQARRGQAEFEAELPAARQRVAAAGAAESESWIEGQQALSQLEATRALTVEALAELDKIGVERAGLPTNAEQAADLFAAVRSAQSLAREQQDELDRLRASLSPA